MNSSIQQQIENYLLGRLSDTEQRALEARLENDPDLQKELKIQQLLFQQVEAIGDQAMKKKLLAIKAKSSAVKQATPRRKYLYRWLSAAAAVALLLLAYFFLRPSPPNPQQLFATHYEAYSLPFSSRDAGTDQQLAQLERFYRQKNYKEALPLIEQLLQTLPNDARLLLARGISQLELNELKAAQQSFNLLIDQQDPFYLEQAQWYAALTALRLNELDQCRTILQSIVQTPDAFYNQKAKDLLKKLN